MSYLNGRSVWIPSDVYNIIQLIILHKEEDQKTIKPISVIRDLLALRNIPRFVTDRYKEETNSDMKKAYAVILTYILKERKKMSD